MAGLPAPVLVQQVHRGMARDRRGGVTCATSNSYSTAGSTAPSWTGRRCSSAKPATLRTGSALAAPTYTGQHHRRSPPNWRRHMQTSNEELAASAMRSAQEVVRLRQAVADNPEKKAKRGWDLKMQHSHE